MTHQIAGGQIFRAAAQKTVQAVYLTGRPGKQHRAAFQKLTDLSEYAAQIALHIFGPPQLPQILLTEAGNVPQMLMGVHGGAVYHAASLQHIFRNGGKRAAGGGVFSDGVVPVPGGKGSGQMRRRLLQRKKSI